MKDEGDWLEQQRAREQLHAAAQQGDLAKVQRLIADGFPVNAFDDDQHWTPLHHAADAGHLEVMKALIEAGADANAHDEWHIGNSPLGEEAGRCSHEVAQLLIDAGANPRIPGWMRITALDESTQRRTPEGARVHGLLQGAAARLRPR